METSFDIIPKTIEEIEIKKREEEKSLNSFLYKIGFNSAGCYILNFPNGKKFLGSSATLGKRIKYHFKLLFPTPKQQLSLARKADWHNICREENKGKLKDFRNIRIEVFYTLAFKEKERELRKEIMEKGE